MVASLIHKAAVTAAAGVFAVISGVRTDAEAVNASAYGPPIAALDVNLVADAVERQFARGDLDNNGRMDAAEYETLAVVTAELAHLNGFTTIEANRTAYVLKASGGPSAVSIEAVRAAAAAEFTEIAGEDGRLTEDEYALFRLEQFWASDLDRNGMLVGPELAAFAQTYARTRIATS